MRVIADGGATSVDWALLGDDGRVEYLSGGSLSPFYLDESGMVDVLERTFDGRGRFFCEGVESVEFYGAGCEGDPGRRVVRGALERYFGGAEIDVDSDMVCAARSVYGEGERGLVGILGTGSNACYWDGDRALYAMPSLGFIFGDEGSGGSIGRRVIRDWLYGLLPEELSSVLDGHYGSAFGVVRSGAGGSYRVGDFVQYLYGEGLNSSYVSGFARVVLEHQEQSYSREVLEESFLDFLCVLMDPHRCYISSSDTERVLDLGVRFVGSVAWYGREVLYGACRSCGYRLDDVARSPLEGLVFRRLGS